MPYASVRDVSARIRDAIPEPHRPAVLRQLRKLGTLRLISPVSRSRIRAMEA